jgi:hypothetical protein
MRTECRPARTRQFLRLGIAGDGVRTAYCDLGASYFRRNFTGMPLAHLLGHGSTIERTAAHALSESLRTLANVMAAAFVFTTLVTQQSASFRLVGAGILGWFVLITVALYLIGKA